MMRKHLHLNSELFWFCFRRSSWGNQGYRSPYGLERNTTLRLKYVWVSKLLFCFFFFFLRILKGYLIICLVIANVTVIIINVLCFLGQQIWIFPVDIKIQATLPAVTSPPTPRCPQIIPPALLSRLRDCHTGTSGWLPLPYLCLTAFLKIPSNFYFPIQGVLSPWDLNSHV